MIKNISFLILCALFVGVFAGCDKKAQDLGTNQAQSTTNGFDFSALKSEAEAQNIDLSKIILKDSVQDSSNPSTSSTTSTPQITKSMARFYLLGGEILGEKATLYLKISSAPDIANIGENQSNALAYITGKIVRGGEIFTLKGEVDLTQNIAQDSPKNATENALDSKPLPKDLSINQVNPKAIQLEITNESSNLQHLKSTKQNQATQIFEAQIAQNGEVSGRFVGSGFFTEGISVDFKRAGGKINEIAILGVSVAQKHKGKDFDGSTRDFDFNVATQIPLIRSDNKIDFALDTINSTLRETAMPETSEYGDDSTNFSSVSSFEIDYIDEKIIVFGNYKYLYSGGAHGNYSDDAISFDINSGEKLTNEPNALLKDENDPSLRAMIKARLKAEYGNSVDENAALSRFRIRPNGVEFYWGTYEIAAYAVGIVTIRFDFSEIAPFVREDSPYYYLFVK